MADQITTKPFQSRRQQRWAFSTRQPFRKRWAKQTDFSRLPEKKDVPPVATAAPAHGPGGLLSAPGMNASLPKRKKRMPLNAKPCASCPLASTKGEQIAPGITRIRGNLCNVHGRYGMCPGAKKGGAKPKKGKAPAKPKKVALTPEQKRQARDAEHAKNTQATLTKLNIGADGQAALDALRRGEQPDPVALERGGFVKAGLVEQAADGSYRMTGSGRALMNAAAQGDTGRAGDIISGARDRTSARTQRVSAAAERKRQAEQKRQQAAAQRTQRQQQAQARRAASSKKKPKRAPASSAKPTPEDAASRVGLSPANVDALKKAASGAGGLTMDVLRPLEVGGLTSDGAITPAGRRALAALQRGDVAGFNQAVLEGQRAMQTTKATWDTAYLPLDQIAFRATWDTAYVNNLPDSAFLFVESGGTKDGEGKTVPRSKRHFPYKDAGGAVDLPHLRNAIARIPQSNAPGLNKDATQKRAQSLLSKANASGKEARSSFTVFKQADGHYRWLGCTTNAYLDRDGEIISTKTLEDDCARADADGLYGPLRWWHLGEPNPFDAVAPWGPGLDLGACDFNAMSGRMLIESGTFKDDALGALIAQHVDAFQFSPGFFHPLTDPDQAGVYHHIRRFERSLVPAGRAANPYTWLTVTKGQDHMLEEKVKQLKQLLGGTPEAATAVDAVVSEAGLAQKELEQQGVAYKDAPEWAQALIQEMTTLKAEVAALKAPMMAGGDMMGGGGAMDAEDMMDQGADESVEADGSGGLTLSPEDISAIGQAVGQAVSAVLSGALSPLVSAMDLTNKMGASVGEIKAMLGAYQTQKDAKDAEAQQQIASVDARVKALEGDLPRGQRDAFRAALAPETVVTKEQAAALTHEAPGGPFDDLFKNLISTTVPMSGGFPPAN